MPDLSALIERLEKASGPDREIDRELMFLTHKQVRRHIGGECDCCPDGKHLDLVWVDLATDKWVTTAKYGFQLTKYGFQLTASIDAALAFVERVLPGWRVSIDSDQDRGPMWRAAVKPCGSHYTAKPTGWIYAMQATAPLAILIASLKALQEREGEGSN